MVYDSLLHRQFVHPIDHDECLVLITMLEIHIRMFYMSIAIRVKYILSCIRACCRCVASYILRLINTYIHISIHNDFGTNSYKTATHKQSCFAHNTYNKIVKISTYHTLCNRNQRIATQMVKLVFIVPPSDVVRSFLCSM